MSRIGRLPVKIPAGVTVTLEEDNVVAVKGPKGALSARIHRDMQIENKDGELKVIRPSDSKQHRSLHGLSRSLISNMVIGVTEGYAKTLEMSGIGYRAQLQGNKLTLLVGYSHPVELTAPAGITFEVPAQTRIVVRGIDKQLVGEIAANVRSVRKPEPYMGYGIRYENEVIRRKEGKAGKK